MIRVWTLAGFALAGLALGAGIAWYAREEPPRADENIGAAVGDQRPHFRHADLDGNWVEPADFDGRLLLANFWATWCAPCLREMPLLQETYEQHGDELVVLGIAIDEPGAVREFVTELGITYPILIGAADVFATQRAWGNRSGTLPYTVLVDRDGIIRWQHLGEVTADELETVLEKWQ